MSVIQVLCQMQRYRDEIECLSLRGSQSRGGITEFISVPVISLFKCHSYKFGIPAGGNYTPAFGHFKEERMPILFFSF